MTPTQVRAKLAELKALCLSDCVMTYADRFDHVRAVAIQRARDEAKRAGGPQIRMEGV